jgi:hypothetical protein
MKKIQLILISVSLSLMSCAQDPTQSPDGHYTIGILPVTSSTGDNTYNDQVAAIVSGVFSSKGRFTVVDQSTAQYLISANINSVITNNIQLQKSQIVKDPYSGKYVTQYYNVPGIDATITVSMQATEVSTGSVKSSKIVTAAWRTETDWTNTGIAINNAVNYLPGFIKGWANEVFPVDLKVLKIESYNKKGLPDKILIKGGSDTDLEKKKGNLFGSWAGSSSRLQVYENEVINADGKVYNRPVKIGEVKVDEVQGDLTVCKVTDGADAIKREMDAGKTLLLKILSY